jgi:shikimate dehydrogenase
VTQRRVAALIGSPVAHSLSPVIHQAAFDAEGDLWTYAAFDVADGKGTEAIAAMRVLGIAGLSVTMPHKHDVAAAVDRLDPAAAALRSVNTVSWEGGDLVGSSTDGAGFIAALAEEGIDVHGLRVAIIGAGGAARSVIDALGRSGVESIRVVNRTMASAESASELTRVAAVGTVDDIGRADLVVNASSVGMGVDPSAATADDLPCAVERLQAAQVVVDLVYHPLRTAWLQAADQVGSRTIDGLGMLIHQAALQQVAWLGRHPDVAVMRRAAEAALAERFSRATDGRPPRPAGAGR